MRGRFVAMVSAMLCASVASAEPWTWSTRVTRVEFPGGLAFEYHARPFQRAKKPRTVVLVKKHGTTLAEHSGLGFETVIATPDGNLFVALSNWGPLAFTAVAVFTEQGHLILHADHSVAAFPFCEKTATTPRQWYDAANPDLQFDRDLYFAGITLNDCRGQRVNLQKAVSQAVAAGAERIETRVGRRVPAPGSPAAAKK